MADPKPTRSPLQLLEADIERKAARALDQILKDRLRWIEGSVRQASNGGEYGNPNSIDRIWRLRAAVMLLGSYSNQGVHEARQAIRAAITQCEPDAVDHLCQHFVNQLFSESTT